MFIKNLNIKTFRVIKDLEIKFDKPKQDYFKNLNISILVGENGTGKSSILQLLTYIFCPSQRNSLNINMNCALDYELNGKIIHYDIGKTYPQNFPTKLIVSSYSVFDPYQPPWLPRMRRHLEKTKKDVKETEYVYCGPNEYGSTTLEPVIHSILQSIFIPKDDKEKFKIYNKILKKIGCKQAKTFIVFREKLDNEMKRSKDKNYEKAIQYYQRLHELGKKYNYETIRNRRMYSIPMKHFNEELLALYNNVVEWDLDPCIRDISFENLSGDNVFLSELSSGEITMLFRFLPLMLEIQNNALIVIDEPETHLHPLWAQEFIVNIINYFQEYKVQVLIATHSPTIISDVPKECIIGLRKLAGAIQAYYPKNRTLGGEPSQLLYDVLGLQQLHGEFATEKINFIKKMLESEDISPEDLLNVRRIYNDLSTTIEKYQLYEKYEKLLEE